MTPERQASVTIRKEVRRTAAKLAGGDAGDTRGKPLSGMTPHARQRAHVSKRRETEEKRGAMIQVKVTDEERTIAFALADARKLPLSRYVRALMLLDKRGKVEWGSES